MLKKHERTHFRTPRFPDFPYGEWKDRIAKAQNLMAKNGVDCLVLWGRENVRYFFGFQTIHWYVKSIQPAVGVIPVNGEPLLIVPDLFRVNVEGLCWVKDIRIQLHPHQPISQRELPREVGDVIKEIGYGSRNIGLEMGPLGCMWIPRPLNDIEMFKRALPDAKFVDGDKVVWGCRMIKSSLEIERITKSITAIAAVELAIVEGYRPGMTEVDIMKIISHARAEQEGNCLGDDGLVTESLNCAREKHSFADIAGLEGAMISRGDFIRFDGSFTYKGYNPDSARKWQIGPITKEIEKCYVTIFEAEDSVERMLKPGVKAIEVYEAMYQPIKSAGFSPIDMGGHGTGLDIHEPPSIDGWNEMTIEEGMTLSIEPWINSEKEGLFGIQDTFVVTDKGCTKFEGLRRDIIQVSHPIL
jgi:Xaa-Pro dipeptidase